MKLHVYLHFPGKFPSLKLCLCTPEHLSAWWEAPEKGGGTQVWNSPAHSRIQVDSRGVIGLGHELCQEGLEIETVLPGQIQPELAQNEAGDELESRTESRRRRFISGPALRTVPVSDMTQLGIKNQQCSAEKGGGERAPSPLRAPAVLCVLPRDPCTAGCSWDEKEKLQSTTSLPSPLLVVHQLGGPPAAAWTMDPSLCLGSPISEPDGKTRAGVTLRLP